MSMKTKLSKVLGTSVILTVGMTAYAGDKDGQEDRLRAIYNGSVRYVDTIQFPQLITGDPVHGKALFGINAAGQIDTSQALFQGNSVVAGTVVSNGTACSTCHRPDTQLFLPPLPISSTIAANDPLRTGRNAEAQGDPRQAALFENFGLVKQRASRFNPTRPETDPYRELFTWRKTQTIVNTVFGYGLLTDGRARAAPEQIRGAIFTHTQDTDYRFEDLEDFALPDIAAWMQTQVSQPELKDLLDPAAPLYNTLVADPFYTVQTSNWKQDVGKYVFEQSCMSCHNMPNVFSNRDHINGPPTNFPTPYGHTFDIGVAQANKHHLDFRYYDATTQTYSTLIAPMAREDGKTLNVPVVDDWGLGAATSRYEDLHRFKVPQLRNISKLGPYFHDNSAATLEEVVEYFNSDDYNRSEDGKTHPIHLNSFERDALLEFLRIL